jgi:hypothetical protein
MELLRISSLGRSSFDFIVVGRRTYACGGDGIVGGLPYAFSRSFAFISLHVVLRVDAERTPDAFARSCHRGFRDMAKGG